MRSVSRGRQLARELLARATPEAVAVRQRIGRAPTLAIVAAGDHASRRFVDIKMEMLAAFPLRIDVAWLEPAGSSEAALDRVAQFNERAEVDAIFIQFPLPESVDPQLVADAVAATKDIDCSSNTAESEFHVGACEFAPVAPLAALDLLIDQLAFVKGRHVGVVGAPDAFTRALERMLQKEQALVTRISGNELPATSAVISADAMIITETLPDARLFNAIEQLPVLLDAGYYLPPRPADWIPASARSRIGIHLTQYGNVGPLTVAHLAASTIRAASNRAPAG